MQLPTDTTPRNTYVPTNGIHGSKGETTLETPDQILDVEYNPDDEANHTVEHRVDRRITPTETPGPNLSP